MYNDNITIIYHVNINIRSISFLIINYMNAIVEVKFQCTHKVINR